LLKIRDMKQIGCVLFVVLLISGTSGIVAGQSKFAVSTELGYPENLTLGIRYLFKQEQLGFSMGYLSFGNSSVFSMTADVYNHFGGKSHYSKRYPWYGRFGFIYVDRQTEQYFDTFLFLNARIGRDLNITRKFGFQLDLGFAYKMIHKKVERIPVPGFDFSGLFRFYPAFGMGMFLKL